MQLGPSVPVQEESPLVLPGRMSSLAECSAPWDRVRVLQGWCSRPQALRAQEPGSLCQSRLRTCLILTSVVIRVSFSSRNPWPLCDFVIGMDSQLSEGGRSRPGVLAAKATALTNPLSSLQSELLSRCLCGTLSLVGHFQDGGEKGGGWEWEESQLLTVPREGTVNCRHEAGVRPGKRPMSDITGPGFSTRLSSSLSLLLARAVSGNGGDSCN